MDGSDFTDAVLPEGLSVAPPLSGSSATTARTFAELKSFLSNEELKRQNDEGWSINQAVKNISLEKTRLSIW